MFGHDARHSNRTDADTRKVRGIIKWKYKIEGSHDHGPSEFYSPIVDVDGTIYVAWGTEDHHKPADGGLYAINPDGTLKWKFDARVPCSLSTSAVDKDAIYFPSGYFWSILKTDLYAGSLYAIDFDGSIKWKVAGNGGAFSSPTVGSDGTIYVVLVRLRFPGMKGFTSSSEKTFTAYLVALAPEGSVKWQVEIGTKVDTIFSQPAVDRDGTIYVTASDDSPSAGATIYAFASNGDQRWKVNTDTKGFFSQSALASDGTLYIGFDPFQLDKQEAVFYAISGKGIVRWTFRTRNELLVPPALGADGTIYIGPVNKTLYAFRPDGTVKWRFEYQGSGLGPMAVSGDGTIFALGAGQYLYAVRADGTLKWKSDMRIASFLAIGADGTLYATSRDGYLLAIH